jgi:hypothetical protein
LRMTDVSVYGSEFNNKDGMWSCRHVVSLGPTEEKSRHEVRFLIISYQEIFQDRAS